MHRPSAVVYWLIFSVSTLTISLTGTTPAQDDRDDGGYVPGLMPKQETGALEFLKRNPKFDGRGVVVAIFDTGVDPGVAGLQETSDGRPKVIDIVDATGSGDVDTSKVVKPENGMVTGLSGRRLKLNKKWKITDGEVRIGMKAGYELFPQELVGRVKAHRRREFDEKQRAIENDLRQQIADYDKKKSKVDKDELEKRLAALQAAGKSYKDPGPIYDCVVYHDGAHWRASVDTDEDGDFSDEKAMTNYRDFREHSTFDEVSLLNFGVNVYEDGDVLSIVADAHPHGTHVAGIVAANWPDNPSLNGVAPGAQIVSVKIGDTYLDGMETGQALIRGVKTVLENKCDLINMSFGEPTKTPNKGLIIRYFSELVDRHGVIFCASAGNAGPALSTVGAPGGTTSSLIGIGAHVSPQMAAAQYALRETADDLPYTWTSRGPTFDGDIGVNLFAPGGAIAPVPQWTLDRVMQMNGTSMASPNCCGNIALVLSAMKAEGITYSPESVRRAFENTARPIEGASPWAQGTGLIQTPDAFEALARDQGRPAELIRIAATTGGKRGIYLREPLQAGDDADPQEFRLNVAPQFHPDATSMEKVNFHLRLELQSTADWVRCGEQITLAAAGELMSVLVDPRELEPGVHFAEIYGIDPEHPDRGPLLRFPITVTRLVPTVDEGNEEELEELEEEGIPHLAGSWMEEHIEDMHPGRIERRFVGVPHEATWADVRFHLEPGDDGGRRRMFMVHFVQAIPGWTNRDGEKNNFLVLEPGVEKVVSFPVQPGRTMEMAIAQYWSSLGSCNLHYELTFHGITSGQREVRLQPGDQAVQVEVSSSLHFENLAPSASLTTSRRLVKPSSATVTQLAEDRDGFSRNRRFHLLELTYAIEQSSAGSVTPRFLKTDDLLYDSEFGGTVWAIYEAGGRRVATDDIWVHPVSLGKGSYTLKLWIRHDSRSKLDALKSMPMALDRPLGSPVSLSVYATHVDAVNGETKFSGGWTKPREVKRMFVANISSAPAGALAGDVLLGSITYGKAGTHNGAGQLPGGFPLSVVVATTDAPASVSATGSSSWTWIDPATAKSDKAKLNKAIRDAKLAFLKSLSIDSNRKGFDKLSEELLKKDDATLPVLVTKLHKLDDVKKRKERLKEVVEAADAVLEQIDKGEIATALIGRPDADDKDDAKNRKQAENLKSLLIDTLYRKGRALGYMELPKVAAKKPVKDKKSHNKQFEETYKALSKWVDPTGDKHFLLHIRRAARKGNIGESLKWLNKYSGGAAPNYWHLEKRRKYYSALGWEHLTDNAWHWRTLHFPGGKP